MPGYGRMLVRHDIPEGSADSAWCGELNAPLSVICLVFSLRHGA
jgi:hypothetical protein